MVEPIVEPETCSGGAPVGWFRLERALSFSARLHGAAFFAGRLNAVFRVNYLDGSSLGAMAVLIQCRHGPCFVRIIESKCDGSSTLGCLPEVRRLADLSIGLRHAREHGSEVFKDLGRNLRPCKVVGMIQARPMAIRTPHLLGIGPGR